MRPSSPFPRLPLACLLPFCLAGCSLKPYDAPQADIGLPHSGIVQGGQQPIAGASIQLYAVGTTAFGAAASPLIGATVTTSDGTRTMDSNANAGNANNTLPVGYFTITGDYTCPSASTLVYLVATGGNPGLAAGTNNAAIAMMAALGQCGSISASTFISVNEVTTVGSLAALYPYMTSATHLGSDPGNSAQLASAFSLVNEFTNTATGTAYSPEINTLGNVVASCINSLGGTAGDGSACGTLFTLATPPTGQVPTDTIGALIDILNNPTQNVSALFNLSGSIAPFQPSLSAAPSNWILFATANPPAPTFAVIPTLSASLGQKIAPTDLSQYELGGAPPLAYSIMSESNSQAINASMSGSVLQSDYAYHGGINSVTVSVTDANRKVTQTTVTVIVPIPQVAHQVFGIDYSPYVGTQNPNNGTVINDDQLTQQIGAIAPYTTAIRTFGCTSGLEDVAKIAKRFGLKVYVGIWIGKDPTANNTELQNCITVAQSVQVDAAIIGSEALLRNDVTPAQLIAYINQFRSAVPGVPVTTADQYLPLENNPAVVAVCDFVFANYYPFWEGTDISTAVASLNAEDALLRATYAPKEVIVSETGWQSFGNTHVNAVPSPQNAASYFLNFESWAEAGQRKTFYFEDHDELWKGIDDGWGIWDNSLVMKPGMINVFNGVTVADNWTCKAVPGGSGTPQLQFTTVPQKGSSSPLVGQEWHAAPASYYVVVYIHVGQYGWWVKPTFNSPLTTVACDGSWTTNIVTGGSDASADQIAAFLIPTTYSPPALGGAGSLPAELYTNSVANVIVAR